MSDWKASDELGGIPLGTAAEERERAKAWMDTAAQHCRNEDYWRKMRLGAELERDEARRLCVQVFDLLTSCCVCGVVLIEVPPHCEDGCNPHEQDGECFPAEEWRQDFANKQKAIEQWRKEGVK